MDQPLFRPTGEGDYRLRNGEKVNLFAFCWGYWCGKTAGCELDEFEMWRRNGTYKLPGGEPSRDIVGKWAEAPAANLEKVTP